MIPYKEQIWSFLLTMESILFKNRCFESDFFCNFNAQLVLMEFCWGWWWWNNDEKLFPFNKKIKCLCRAKDEENDQVFIQYRSRNKISRTKIIEECRMPLIFGNTLEANIMSKELPLKHNITFKYKDQWNQWLTIISRKYRNCRKKK